MRAAVPACLVHQTGASLAVHSSSQHPAAATLQPATQHSKYSANFKLSHYFTISDTITKMNHKKKVVIGASSGLVLMLIIIVVLCGAGTLDSKKEQPEVEAERVEKEEEAQA